MGETKVIKTLKKGHFVLIDGVPCKVVSIAIAKSGKHGGAKARVEGIGLFDGRRRSIIKPGDAKVNVPIILRKNAQLLAIVGEKAQLMDLTDYSTFELTIPEDMKGKVNPGEELNYFEVGGVRTLEKLK